MKDSHSFVDEAHITVASGNGGDGMASFRREKFAPLGGPDGGDGGRGGDVVLLADRNLNTLSDYRYRRHIQAQSGGHGGTNGRTGAGGEDCVMRVPVGTVVIAESGETLADLTEDGERWVAVRGGRGGLGNTRFKNAVRQAPDFATPGRPGETLELRLSLKLLADVGFVGLPNAGKSTLLRRVSAARPRVAAYPFTTLNPSLGVAELGDRRFVVADIPGLIEGASDGAGLGDRFLRHVERTRVLVHVLDLGAMLFESRDPLVDYDTIRGELGRYEAGLLDREEITVLNKTDLVTSPEQLDALEATLQARGLEVLRVSGATGDGVTKLIEAMVRGLDRADARAAAESQADAQSTPREMTP